MGSAPIVLAGSFPSGLRTRRPARIPPAIARQLDRLARRAHAFHRYAHHPLCEQYRGELIQLRGRRRICRGCTFALVGTANGVALGALLPISMSVAACIAALAAVLAAMSVRRHPAKSGALPRRSKLLTRALPAGGLAFALGCCTRAQDGIAIALASGILAVAYALHCLYRRRGAERSPCRDCKERALAVPCSGFRDIVRAERAFVRRSHALLDRTHG